MGFREINMVSGLVNMHGPIWQTFETISARNPSRLFQKFISAARHGRPSTACSHGPLWRTSATIGARNPCRLFQKSLPAARHGRSSTARSDELLQQSAPGIRAVCFKSPSRRPVTAVRPRPDPTARPGGLLQQSAWGIRAVCFKSPSQRPVTTGRPRPDLADFWNNRHKESVPFVSKVHPSGSSRQAVHDPLWRNSETIGARNLCRLFQKYTPAARHDRPSTARSDGILKQSAQGICAVCFKSTSQRPVTDVRPRPAPTARSDWLLQQSAPGIRAVCFKSPSRGGPSRPVVHGPLWRTSATIGARNPCRLFQKSVPAARHGRSSTARSDELLQQSAPGIRAVCFKSPSRRPVTAGRPRPAPTARSDGLLQQSAPGIRAVCFKSPSRRPVTAVRPRPALTNFCNNRRQESVPFVSKVRPGGPSRPSVHGPTPRPALVDFCNNRRQESVPFVSKVHLSGPSRTSVTARSDELLKQTAPHTAASLHFDQGDFRTSHPYKKSLLMHCIKIKSPAIFFIEWAICFCGWKYFFSLCAIM